MLSTWDETAARKRNGEVNHACVNQQSPQDVVKHVGAQEYKVGRSGSPTGMLTHRGVAPLADWLGEGEASQKQHAVELFCFSFCTFGRSS